jgi:hypothetical protein
VNIHKLIARLVMSLLIACALAACGGPPATLATIPLPPDATRLEAGSNPMADTIADGFRQSMTQQNGKVELQLYALPADAGWEQIRGFYEQQIKDDWKSEAQLAQDAEAFKTIGWTRGGLASEQGLVVGYSPALLDAPPFMMVALFSE